MTEPEIDNLKSSAPFANTLSKGRSAEVTDMFYNGLFAINLDTRKLGAAFYIPTARVPRRTTANDIDSQESSPGFYSPADWGLAFAQTKTATFRWKVVSPSGNLSGKFENSLKTGWLGP